jgi:hypothetical protein
VAFHRMTHRDHRCGSRRVAGRQVHAFQRSRVVTEEIRLPSKELRQGRGGGGRKRKISTDRDGAVNLLRAPRRRGAATRDDQRRAGLKTRHKETVVTPAQSRVGARWFWATTGVLFLVIAASEFLLVCTGSIRIAGPRPHDVELLSGEAWAPCPSGARQ